MTSLYCIEDTKAKAIVCFFSSPNDQTAERSFIDLLTKTEEDVFNQHPEDFRLVHLIDCESNDYGIKTERVCKVVRLGSDLSRPYLDNLRLERQKFLDSLASSRTIGGSEDGET